MALSTRRHTSATCGVKTCLVLATLALLQGFASWSDVHAQTVHGRVLEEGEVERAIPGVEMLLEDSTGGVVARVLADSAGSFWLSAATAGWYTIRATRMGYSVVAEDSVHLPEHHVVEVELHMAPRAVELDPLRVVARRPVRRFTSDEFYDRMGRLKGRGEFVTRERIDEIGALIPSQILRLVPGTTIEAVGAGGFTGAGAFTQAVFLRAFGRKCQPTIYLDGHEVRGQRLDDVVSVEEIEGIEVYRAQSAPGTYRASWGCGAILVWRRPHAQAEFAFSWGRFFLLAGIGGIATFWFFLIM